LRRHLLVSGSAAAGLVLVVALASAQTKKPAPKPQPVPVRAQPPQLAPPPFSTDPLTVSADLVEAMRMVAINPEAALAMLHKLNARSPGRDDVLTRLAYTLQAVEKTDSAAYYYKQALAVNPLNLEAGKALGSIYFAQGQEQQAMSVFNGLLAANEYSLPAYRMVSTAIRDLGRPDEAVVLLEQGRARAKTQDPKGRAAGAFTVEIAGYYKQMGDSRRALDEYLDYVVAEPRNFRFVRDRMIQVIADDDQNRQMLVGYMQTRVEKGGAGSFVAADVLAAYHLQQGELESSLNMAMRADADKMSDGASLLLIGEDAINRAETRPRVERGRYYDLALRSLETYTQRHPQAPMMDRAHFLLAGVYAAYGSGVNATVPVAQRPAYLEKSLNEYAAVSKQFAGGDLAEDAYIARGDVLLRKLKRPKDALDVYRAGSIQARRAGTTYAGRIAEVYIATASPSETERYLKSLSTAGNPPLAQAGQYYAGLYLVTQKKYDAARDTLTSLAEKAPFSEFTNDAIEVAWVLQEGIELKSKSLDDYSACVKADMIGDTTAVVSHLQAIANREAEDPLRPRALKQLGTVLFEAGNYDASIASLRKFLEDYPKNDDCAEVQRSIGHTYEVGLGRYADALKEYEHVLVAYPDYAMLDDVRHDVERARANQGSTYAQ
jgi:tetratricopeptide (TPR) repeat protein